MSHEAADEALLDRLGHPALPLDLLAVVGYVAVAAVLLFRPGVYETPLAVALGVPLLLFVPGYALVSLLFPGAPPDDVADRNGVGKPDATMDAVAVPDATPDAATERNVAAIRQHGLSGVERVALGFGFSVALLPILGIALAASPWTIDPWPVLLSVSALAVSCSVGAAIRRFRRPPDRRFSVPVRAWLGKGRAALVGGSTVESALNLGLAVAVVVSVAAIGFAVAAPGPGQSYTSVSLLAQNETGELVAADYPRNFESGGSKPLVVEVTNHEGEQVQYSVVVELQRVRERGDGGAKVVQDRQLATFTPTVAGGETWRTTHEVTPTMTGEDMRLVYLVYKGEPPQDPTTSNAYRYVHVWVNVSA
jgi:uncharacterized membrane protein